MKRIILVLIVVELFSLQKLNAQTESKKNISFKPKSSTYLDTKNDTITGKQFMDLINSGRFSPTFTVGADEHYTWKLDSVKDELDPLRKSKLLDKTCPITELKLFDGKMMPLRPDRHYIFIFWNSRCKPCIDELDNLLTLSEKNTKSTYFFLTNDSTSRAVIFLKDKVKRMNLVTEAGSIMKKLFINSYPSAILIGNEQIVKKVYFGQLTQQLQTGDWQ